MTRFITISLGADGKGQMLHGPEVPAAVQRATVQRYRNEGVPEGVERVEIWARPIPPIKFACRKPAPAKVVEPPKALAEPDAPKEPAEPQDPEPPKSDAPDKKAAPKK